MIQRFSYLAPLLMVTVLLCAAACSTVNSENNLPPAEGVFSELPHAEGSFPEIGELLYESSLDSEESVADWIMEGPGEISFREGWMEMYSPDEQGHHVFWCPQDFPDSFVAQWEAQNLRTDVGLGLVIVFFAAKGVDGEDIFDPDLPVRDGTFTQYIEGSIKSYHISYYANADDHPDRGHANLRKNNTFSLLQEGEVGIKTESTDRHKMTLIKEQERIRLYVDERKVIDYEDKVPVVNGVDTGGALTDGKIGFRQMQWTQFRYRNLKVYSIR